VLDPATHETMGWLIAAAWDAPVAILQKFVNRPDANYQEPAGAMGRRLNIEDECPF
jgi:hypothetical protein